MLEELKFVLSQSTSAVVEDMLGLVALFCVLIGALCLPGSF
jgi:hypothetical protein